MIVLEQVFGSTVLSGLSANSGLRATSQPSTVEALIRFVPRLLIDLGLTRQGRSAFDPPQSHGQDRGNPNQHIQSVIRFGSLFQTTGIRYAQRYNVRGYPENQESIDLAKRNRHAQNDILRTIGVCINVDEQGEIKPHPNTSIPKSSAEQELARQVIEEHWYGSLISNVSEFSSEAGSMWVSFLRARIQTFDFYQGIPLSSILRSEWRHGSKFAFLAAGVLPDTLYHGTKAFVEWILEYAVAPRAVEWIRKQCIQVGASPEFWISVAGSMYNISFLLFRELTGVMLDIIMYLQALGLISSWPPFPPGTLSLLLQLMPTTPTRWTRATTIVFIKAALLSPITLSFVYHTAREWVREVFFRYLRTVFPRPDNPDSNSYRLVLEDDQVDLEEAPVLQLPTLQRTLSEQFQRDLYFMRITFEDTTTAIGTMLTNTFYQLWPIRRARPTSSGPQNVSFAVDESENPKDEHDLNVNEDALADNAVTDSPPRSPATSSSDIISDLDPSAVQVRTRSGSTSTLHMDLEVQLPLSANQVRERRAGNFAQTDGEVIQVEETPKPPPDQHRVTQLTLHSSWMLNIQTSAILTSILLLPLESFYLRVLTRDFLASKGTESAWLARRVYSPAQLGFKDVGWKSFFVYGGQILICYGLETGLRLYFWRLCGTASLWWGRQMYRWGRL